MPSPSDLALLRSMSPFASLEPAALSEVAACARSERVAAGHRFFREGEAASGCWALAEGRVKITQLSPEGHEIVARLIAPGELFGFAFLFGGELYPASAEALEESRALAWDAGTMERLAHRHPPIALAAMRMVAARLRELEARYRELATERVERRVARAVLRLADQAGRKVAEGVHVDFPLSRQDLASMTGTTLFTVSRILTAWERDGLVSTGRRRLVIRDPQGLVAVAEDLAGD